MVKPLKIIALHFPHKTASMFAVHILSSMAKAFDLPLFSQNNKLPNHADLAKAVARHVQSKEPSIFLRGPVRNFTYTNKAISNPDEQYRFVTPELVLKDCDYFAICQIRDPLDLVVSQYFSHGWIHGPADGFGKMRKRLQAGEISVYDYAQMEFDGIADFGQDSILKKYNDLKDLKKRLGDDNVLVLTYEEMVTNYAAWSRKINMFISGKLELGMPDGCISTILETIEPKYLPPQGEQRIYNDPLVYVRDNENEMKHMRSPWPGDHRRFFSDQQIVNLREIIAQTLEKI